MGVRARTQALHVAEGLRSERGGGVAVRALRGQIEALWSVDERHDACRAVAIFIVGRDAAVLRGGDDAVVMTRW